MDEYFLYAVLKVNKFKTVGLTVFFLPEFVKNKMCILVFLSILMDILNARKNEILGGKICEKNTLLY